MAYYIPDFPSHEIRENNKYKHLSVNLTRHSSPIEAAAGLQAPKGPELSRRGAGLRK
jgi:hypothetical protein